MYDELLRDKITEPGFHAFFKNYKTVLEWCGEPGLKKPGDQKKQRVEFIADRIQIHRQKTKLHMKDHQLLPETYYDDRLSDSPWTPVYSHIIALDGFRSVFNTGSVFRICDAAGFASVLLGNTLGKEHPGVRKTSMGSVNWIPQDHTDNLAQALKEYSASDYRIIGVETISGSISYTDYRWPEKCVLVFGNEEYGLSTSVITACEDFVHIPMYGRKNSMNVANAVSVICFAMTAR